MDKRKTRQKRKAGIIKLPMMNRYGFYTIFQINPQTGLLYPLVNVSINNLNYPAFRPIPQGFSFGGLNLYNYQGRDIAGTWDNNSHTLTILGFY